MRVKVAPGRVVRLTARKNSSNRGGEYDLAELGLSPQECRAIADLDGVTEIKAAKAAAKDDAK